MKAVEQVGLDTETCQLSGYLDDSAFGERFSVLHRLHCSLLVVPLLVLEAAVEVVQVQFDPLIPRFLVVEDLLGPFHQLRHEVLAEDGSHRLGDGCCVVVRHVVPPLTCGKEFGENSARRLGREEEVGTERASSS